MWRHHPSFLTCSGHVGLRTQKASSGMPSGDQLASSLTPQILDLETEPLRVTVSDPRTHSRYLSILPCVLQVLVCLSSVRHLVSLRASASPKLGYLQCCSLIQPWA